jgi:hypothetical protein
MLLISWLHEQLSVFEGKRFLELVNKIEFEYRLSTLVHYVLANNRAFLLSHGCELVLQSEQTLITQTATSLFASNILCLGTSETSIFNTQYIINIVGKY